MLPPALLDDLSDLDRVHRPWRDDDAPPLATTDQPLEPDTRRAIADIAERLRRLPCANSLVAMELHRVARDLEGIVARSVPPANPAAAGAAGSAEKGGE